MIKSDSTKQRLEVTSVEKKAIDEAMLKSEAQPIIGDKIAGDTPSMTHLHANQMSSIDHNFNSVTDATVTNRFGAINKIGEHESGRIILRSEESQDGD